MKMNFDEFENDRMIQDPANYKAGIFYFNRNDDRIVVPKRNKMMGWTLNFAKVYTYVIILAIIFAVLAIKLLS